MHYHLVRLAIEYDSGLVALELVAIQDFGIDLSYCEVFLFPVAPELGNPLVVGDGLHVDAEEEVELVPLVQQLADQVPDSDHVDCQETLLVEASQPYELVVQAVDELADLALALVLQTDFY